MNPVLNYVKRNPKQFGEIAFTLFLMIYGAAVLQEAVKLSPVARLFPIWVMIILAVLIVLKVLTLASPRIKDLLEPKTDLFVVSDLKVGENTEQLTQEQQRLRPRPVIVIGSILLFVVAIFLLGYLYAIPLFLLLYSRFVGRRSWLSSILITVITWAFVYIVFVRLLWVPFFDGSLFS